jgi:DNA-binding response OmpR family regulator
MHIGILEDDDVLAGHLADVLKKAGHTSAIFNSARSFLPALGRNTFDLLVFDWRLPDQDGLKVLRHVRASFQGETPVIFLTAVHDEEAIVTALEAGADDYCVKPLRPAEFLARVAAVQRRIYPAKQMGGRRLLMATPLIQCLASSLGKRVRRSFQAKNLNWLVFSLPIQTDRSPVSA